MTPAHRILLLGGTAEARELALLLDGRPEFVVVSSLAGRVRDPLLPPGEVRSGGFGGVGGLREWLRTNKIEHVVDATHPFATVISDHAVTACEHESVPLTVLRRLPWTQRPGDRWDHVASLDDAAVALDAMRNPATVFLTTGRQDVASFAGITRHRFVIRAIDPPEGLVPSRSTVLLARGPFDLEDELDLMRREAVDIVVTKNSGGEMIRAKLDAARSLGLPVIVVDRPPRRPADVEFATATEVLDHLVRTGAR